MLLLASCGSMNVDDPNLAALPSDFNRAVYSTINPDIAIYQIRAAIVDSNLALHNQVTASDTAVRRVAKATWAADSAAFMADTAFVHFVFVHYAGYPDSLWTGSLEPTYELPMVIVFNIQGENTVQNRAFLTSFVFDSTAIELQYEVYGKAEGRPYKYCGAAGTYGALQDPTSKTQNPGRKIGAGQTDYGDNTFCLNKNDGNIYLNLNK